MQKIHFHLIPMTTFTQFLMTGFACLFGLEDPDCMGYSCAWQNDCNSREGCVKIATNLGFQRDTEEPGILKYQ